MNNDLLIENICRRVLNEYLGVSDEVEKLAYEAYNIIMSFYKDSNNVWKREMYTKDVEIIYKKDDLDYNTEGFTDSVLWKVINGMNVTLYGYDPSETTFERHKNFLYRLDKRLIRLSFAPKDKEVYVRMPMPFNGKIDNVCERFLMTGLYHEIEHAWQSANRGGTKISNSYKKSLGSTDWKTDENSAIPLLKYYVKHCYYSFDSDEIDAKLHELWFEINNGISKLEESEAYQYMQEAIREYKKVVEMISSKNSFNIKFYKREREAFLIILKDELGLNSASQWFKYCEKGIRKYNEQLRRIIGRLYIERGASGNGSFKQYAQNEIPQEDLFRLKRENPSLWRKIVNRLKKLR